MKSEKKHLVFILFIFFLISGCQEDKGKNDYSGVSDLISERNRARYDVSENTPKQPGRTTAPKALPSKDTPVSAKEKAEELSSIILYDEDVKIVGIDSGKTLAKGVAYINKKGQIVRIKILKEP